MVKEEFFKCITNNCTTNEQKICAILQARGFLLKKTKDNYFLLNDCGDQDINYLKKILRKFHLGIIDKVNYQIKIFDNAKIENTKSIFEKHQSCESIFYSGSWFDFLYEMDYKFFEFNVELLDPYIARYVKALNLCGVKTNCSCEGDGPLKSVIVSSDYPWNIWHRCIYNELIPKELRIECMNQMEKELDIKVDDINKNKIYYQLNKIGEYLIDNRDYINKFKKCIINEIKTKISIHSSDETMNELFNIIVSKNLKDKLVLS